MKLSKLKNVLACLALQASTIFLLSCFPACAEPSVVPVQSLNFGRIIPQTSSLDIVLDATGRGVAKCIKPTRCDVTGAYSGELHFFDFGPVEIQLGLPTQVTLYNDRGEASAWLRNMHLYSDTNAFFDKPDLKARIGGELSASLQAFGESLAGIIVIDIITY